MQLKMIMLCIGLLFSIVFGTFLYVYDKLRCVPGTDMSFEKYFYKSLICFTGWCISMLFND